MAAWPWILGGGAGALAVYCWTQRNTSQRIPGGQAVPNPPTSTTASPTGAPKEPLPGRWVWPVGIWRNRKPEISDGFNSPRHTPSGQVIRHGGVDILYRRQPGDPWRAGTTNATTGWVMPDHRAVLAASDGA